MSRPIESILVPTDGSERAKIGARRGIDLAASLGANLHLLSAVDTREIGRVLDQFRAGVGTLLGLEE